MQLTVEMGDGIDSRIPEVSDLWYDEMDDQQMEKKNRSPHTPKTPSQPVIALLIDSLSHISACAISAPLALSVKAFSDVGLRVSARGMNVPSERRASTTAEPVLKKVRFCLQNERQGGTHAISAI